MEHPAGAETKNLMGYWNQKYILGDEKLAAAWGHSGSGRCCEQVELGGTSSAEPGAGLGHHLCIQMSSARPSGPGGAA